MANNDAKKISKALKEGLYNLYGQLIEATEALDRRVYKRVYHEILLLTQTVVNAFGSDPHSTAIELRENIKLAQDVFVDVANARAHNFTAVQNRTERSIGGPLIGGPPNYGRSRPAARTARDALEQPILLDQLKLRRDRLKLLPVKAMSARMADNIIRDLVESQPECRDMTARELAIKVGCSLGTITNTPWWTATMEVTGRGKAKPRAKPPTERQLTGKMLAARPDPKQVNINARDVGDDELRTLIENDKDTEEQVTRLAALEASKGR